jgi:hypothetical protein
MTTQNLLVECWVSGSTPMLQNRATEEALRGETRSNTPAERPDPRDACEAVLYRLPSKQIAVPGGAFARMLREAGSSHKAKGSRKSLKYIVPAAVLIMDDLCGLYLADRKTPITDFETDSRPVTIPATKGRIMRHRPRFNEWSCRVTLRINPTILDEATVRRLMVEGLMQVGIGDFRPEKGGPFGTGDLTSWTIVNQRPLTAAQRRNSAA